MKKTFIIILIFYSGLAFPQSDTLINIDSNYLNHSTSPLSLNSVSVKYLKNNLFIEISGKSNSQTIIKRIAFRLYLYNANDELSANERFNYSEHIYPGEEFSCKSYISVQKPLSSIEEIVVFPDEVQYSINLKWSLSGVIEEQNKLLAENIEPEPAVPDTTIDTLIVEEITIPVFQDFIKEIQPDSIISAIIGDTLIQTDTLEVIDISEIMSLKKEIFAVNITDTAKDTLFAGRNKVIEVLDDAVIVDLGSKYIDAEKKYLIVRGNKASHKKIALAEPVSIKNDKATLRLIYYYSRNIPEVGDIFYEYFELKETFSLSKFMFTHKKEGFLTLTCVSAALSYWYHTKSNDSYEKYQNSTLAEDALKYKNDTENFEKSRNLFIYSAAVFSAGAIISYIYDKIIEPENKNENENYNPDISLYLSPDVKRIIGIKTNF
ncbi:hypothetical protein ACFL4T_08680 [candidate division KSB1 bacterium]